MNSQNDANRKAPFENAGRKLEEESERLITYLNDEVVPAIRQGSSRALRAAADRLSRLAEYMERNRRGK